MEFAPTQYGKTTITSFWHKNDHGRLPTYTIRSCRNGAAGSLGTGVCGTKNNNHVDSLGLDVKHVQEFNWLQSRLIGGVFLDSSDNPCSSFSGVVVYSPNTQNQYNVGAPRSVMVGFTDSFAAE